MHVRMDIPIAQDVFEASQNDLPFHRSVRVEASGHSRSGASHLEILRCEGLYLTMISCAIPMTRLVTSKSVHKRREA